MKHLFLLLLLIPCMLRAQDQARYMEGAVPVVDGNVTFTRDISLPGLSQADIYGSALEWAGRQFVMKPPFQSRILFNDGGQGQIVALGEQYLVFADKALSLDRARMSYQMYLDCQPGRLGLKITSIRYRYNIADKDEIIPAEEQITDEYCLNRKKDRLVKSTGKFRIHTVNLVDSLFSAVEKVFARQTAAPAAQPAVQPAVHPSQAAVTAAIPAENTAGNGLAGYKRISPDKIPGNICKMLSEDWMLVTAGSADSFNMMTAAWGGLGYLFNKPVTFCFIKPSNHTYGLMEKNGTYTLSFYTEAYRESLKYCGTHSGKDVDKVRETGLTPITTPNGSKAFQEAWMIIECRKTVAQPFAPGAVLDTGAAEKWGSKAHKMYIGEILNVWVK